MAKISYAERWSLYWLSSDGEEDCFVVARNTRSAAKVDEDYCGFEHGYVAASKVCSIPADVASRWIKKRKKEWHLFELPWYADNWVLKQLGAQFRERDNLHETLIDDVVYTQSNDGPIPPRLIGRKHLLEFQSIKAFKRYGHEDRYSPSQMTLLSLLGVCVARSQEIEHLIANSFILAAMSPTERKRNLTISETAASWKRKTLGQMIRLIEEGYEIEPIVHDSLRLFLNMRNELVHGLTTSDRYNIHTRWGQDEMIGFLLLFELISRPIREAFNASFYAGIEIGNEKLLTGESDQKIPLTKSQRKKISLFAAFFTPKMNVREQNEC